MSSRLADGVLSECREVVAELEAGPEIPDDRLAKLYDYLADQAPAMVHTIDALQADLAAAQAEVKRLRGVAVALDEFQRDYEIKTWEQGRMPGNDLYGGRLMEIVMAARAALDATPATGTGGHGG